MNREQIEERMCWLEDLYWSYVSRGMAYPEQYKTEYHNLVELLAGLDENG